MLAATILALILGPMGPNPGAAQVKVGPLYLGESVKDVEKTLGRGWRGTVSLAEPGRPQYFNALIYTDGVDQLQVLLWGAGSDARIMMIVARQRRAEGGTFQQPETLRSWLWAGGTLFEMPASVRGWSAYHWKPGSNGDQIASYDYRHPLSVWFTKNQWGGVDFHFV
ncbi:MAG: hypothetical protein ACHQY2_03770 [Candidatus Eremiobacterales bacterium]